MAFPKNIDKNNSDVFYQLIFLEYKELFLNLSLSLCYL